jgi:quinol monooxygenase YgiN
MQSEHLRAFLEAAPDLIAGDMDLRQFAMISKKSSPAPDARSRSFP